MKETIKLVAVLTIICAASAALLAAVYNVTIKPISDALEIKTVEAAQAVMPPGSFEIKREVINTNTFFVARDTNGKIVAVAVEGLSQNGYGGEISLMVGLSTDQKVVGYKVITANETPGLGTKIASPQFSAQFAGKPFSSNWQIGKGDDGFDAITSATISSRAALECITDAISKYQQAQAQLKPNS